MSPLRAVGSRAHIAGNLMSAVYYPEVDLTWPLQRRLVNACLQVCIGFILLTEEGMRDDTGEPKTKGNLHGFGRTFGVREVSPELTPVERIKQVFLQFEFAVKLMNYFELKKVDKQEFDTDTIVLLDQGSISFRNNAFQSYNDLILAAQNSYQITLGATAITLDDSLDEAGIKHDASDSSPRGQLRKLVYMIRCAFAHDMLTPRWCVNSTNVCVLDVKLASQTLRVDLANLNGKLFDNQDIGGVIAYLEIKDAVLRLITEAEVSNKDNR